MNSYTTSLLSTYYNQYMLATAFDQIGQGERDLIDLKILMLQNINNQVRRKLDYYDRIWTPQNLKPVLQYIQKIGGWVTKAQMQSRYGLGGITVCTVIYPIRSFCTIEDEMDLSEFSDEYEKLLNRLFMIFADYFGPKSAWNGDYLIHLAKVFKQAERGAIAKHLNKYDLNIMTTTF